MTDRYDGNGPPVWHDHFWPAESGEDFTDDEFRFDALEFVNGKFAVWSAQTSQIVEYQPTRMKAKRAAKSAARDAYRKKHQGQ